MGYGSGLYDLVRSLREGDVVGVRFDYIHKVGSKNGPTCGIDMMGFERWYGTDSAVCVLMWVMEGILREALHFVGLDLVDPRFMVNDGHILLSTLTEFGDSDKAAKEAGKLGAYEEDVKNFDYLTYRVVKLKKTG